MKDQSLQKLLERIELTQGFDLKELCFDKQLEFIEDKSSFKTACCSRRAGKTVADAAYLIKDALSKPRVVCLYITLSRINGKKLIWPELLELNRRFKLGGTPHETDLSLTFPNGSVIYVAGAGNESEIEKFRGLPIYLCIIDECQAFKPYIQRLIDEVISKALFDYAGTLALTGTPGPVPAGYFYDTCHSSEYRHFAWTFFDNPYIQIKSGKTPQELLERELKRKGVSIEDPTIQRECFGRWVTDLNALVFRYDSTRNAYTGTPSCNQYVIGVDLGYDDADAIAVLGWHDKIPGVYLIEERIERKQGISELATLLDSLITLYKPLRVVMDTGGLGKKIAEEIRKRHTLPITAAEKARKFEYIELTNDALRTGLLRARANSTFANDCRFLEWDRDPQAPTEKLKVKDSFHSDICDAVLYAYREALHWLYKEEAPKVDLKKPGAWAKYTEKLMEDSLENQIALQKSVEAEQDFWGLADAQDENDVAKYYVNKKRHL